MMMTKNLQVKLNFMEKNKAAVELGSLGGKARARKLSKERIIEIAKIGARARWDKKRRD